MDEGESILRFVNALGTVYATSAALGNERFQLKRGVEFRQGEAQTLPYVLKEGLGYLQAANGVAVFRVCEG